MIAIDVKELVEAAPILLDYFVPGFITQFLFCAFTKRKLSGTERTIWSVVISYCIVHLIDEVGLPILPLQKYGIIVATSILLSIILAVFIRIPAVNSTMIWAFNRTINDSIWNDFLDFENGNMLVIKMKGNDKIGILGNFINIEENGLDSWFALEDYARIDLDTRKIIPIMKKFKHPSVLFMNLRDVETVELHYSSDTKIPKRNRFDGINSN